MKKVFFILAMAVAIGSGAGLFALAQNKQEGIMAYCALGDLQAACGDDRIAGWSRLNPDTADRAIADSGGGN
jgi:hypothetical protein